MNIKTVKLWFASYMCAVILFVFIFALGIYLVGEETIWDIIGKYGFFMIIVLTIFAYPFVKKRLR